MRGAAFAYAPYDDCSFDVPVLDEGDVNARVWIRIREVEQSLSLIEQILDAPARRARSRTPLAKGKAGEGLALVEGSAAMFWSGCGSTATAASRAAICAIRPGSSGRCWKRRSKATSSPTSRSATNRSTAPIRGTISRVTMRKTAVRKPYRTARSPSRRRRPTRPRLAELAQARRPRARAPGSAAGSRSARSTPAPAMAASWKSTRSTTPSTISSASACASSPRRAMPTC